jgi:hypothetical protein
MSTAKASPLVLAAICLLAVGCGGHMKTATTTTHLSYELSLSRGPSVGRRTGSEMSFGQSRPLTRAAAAREVRAYMHRHYGANVVARCTKDGQFFMACSFRRGAGCAQLGVANADNGAEPIVVTGVLPAPRSSCT